MRQRRRQRDRHTRFGRSGRRLQSGGDIQPGRVTAGDSVHHRTPEIFVGINPTRDGAGAAQFYLCEKKLGATALHQAILLAPIRSNYRDECSDGYLPAHALRTRAVSLGIQIAMACAFLSASLPPTAAPRTFTVACVAARESTRTPLAPRPAASLRTDFKMSPFPT